MLFYASIATVILATICFIYAHSTNGKGPDAGCAGVLAALLGIGFLFGALLMFAFYLGGLK